MVLLFLGVTFLVVAAACGIAVYRTGRTRPVRRALVTFGILLATPVLAFGLSAAVLTTGLSLVAAVGPVGLLGVGLYLVAEGDLPIRLQWPQQAD